MVHPDICDGSLLITNPQVFSIPVDQQKASPCYSLSVDQLDCDRRKSVSVIPSFFMWNTNTKCLCPPVHLKRHISLCSALLITICTMSCAVTETQNNNLKKMTIRPIYAAGSEQCNIILLCFILHPDDLVTNWNGQLSCRKIWISKSESERCSLNPMLSGLLCVLCSAL